MQNKPSWRDALKPKERTIFARLNTPVKIQDYLDGLAINFDADDDTCSSPSVAMRRKTVHCIEAALIAASIMKFHGQAAWLLDLKANSHDYDHVMCLFKVGGKWGAISKTRYLALRYREPIYATVRELAMSCFHEYINQQGEKTLRSYSAPFSMSRYGHDWTFSQENLWHVADDLDKSRHFNILPKGHKLRKASKFEAWASENTEWVETRTGPKRRKMRVW